MDQGLGISPPVEIDPDEDVEVGVPGSDPSSESVSLVEGGVRTPPEGLPDADGMLTGSDEAEDSEGVLIPPEEEEEEEEDAEGVCPPSDELADIVSEAFEVYMSPVLGEVVEVGVCMVLPEPELGGLLGPE